MLCKIEHGIDYTKNTITSYHSSFANIPNIPIACTSFANTPIIAMHFDLPGFTMSQQGTALRRQKNDPRSLDL